MDSPPINDHIWMRLATLVLFSDQPSTMVRHHKWQKSHNVGESRTAILAQLRPMIAELRKVPRPQPLQDVTESLPTTAQTFYGIDGGQLFDGNLPNKRF